MRTGLNAGRAILHLDCCRIARPSPSWDCAWGAMRSTWNFDLHGVCSRRYLGRHPRQSRTRRFLGRSRDLNWPRRETGHYGTVQKRTASVLLLLLLYLHVNPRSVLQQLLSITLDPCLKNATQLCIASTYLHSCVAKPYPAFNLAVHTHV